MPPLTLKNTYTRALETFAPLDPTGPVTMYTCGPTVYSRAHIGNFRSFLFADVLRRALERAGHRVHQVMNITDVGHMTEDHLADAEGEDKLAVAARQIGTDPYSVARHFTALFEADARALRLRIYQAPEDTDPALHPRATGYVPEMLAMIQALLERGFAYTDHAGQVYFEVARFPEYGALSGKVLDELEAGARVAVRDEKRDARDFALWKVDPKHLMQWDPHGPAGWPADDHARLRALLPGGVDPRVGRGFPGWHIECSAMARALLGATIDLHTGGEDNIFPHHECEVAQSYGALGLGTPAPPGAADAPAERKSFARFWVHGRHLLVDGKKMSKRDGTFYTVQDLLDPVAAQRPALAAALEAVGFPGGRVPAPVLRYALVSNPYTQPMNFTFELLTQARGSVERLQGRYDRLREAAAGAGADGAPGEALRARVLEAERGFDAGLSDNLNVPRALAAVFEFVTALNQQALGAADAAHALRFLEGVDAVLDVLDRTERSGGGPRGQRDPRADAVTPDVAAALPTSAPDGAAVARWIGARHAAKRAKDFARADAIRAALRACGVALEDVPTGVRWTRG